MERITGRGPERSWARRCRQVHTRPPGSSLQPVARMFTEGSPCGLVLNSAHRGWGGAQYFQLLITLGPSGDQSPPTPSRSPPRASYNKRRSCWQEIPRDVEGLCPEWGQGQIPGQAPSLHAPPGLLGTLVSWGPNIGVCSSDLRKGLGVEHTWASLLPLGRGSLPLLQVPFRARFTAASTLPTPSQPRDTPLPDQLLEFTALLQGFHQTLELKPFLGQPVPGSQGWPRPHAFLPPRPRRGWPARTGLQGRRVRRWRHRKWREWPPQPEGQLGTARMRPQHWARLDSCPYRPPSRRLGAVRPPQNLSKPSL